MFHRVALSVLDDGGVLFVIVHAERTVDRPVMGHCYILPLGIIALDR